MVRFLSLSSGSNGNCYYFGNENTAFLIDAGIGPRTIKKRLAAHNIPLTSIKFVLLTHEHIDHIRGVASLASKFSLPIYATQRLHNVLSTHFCTRGYLNGCVYYLEPDVTSNLDNIKITPFEVPHDAAQTMGYFIDIDGVKFTLATDVGDITPALVKYASAANVLIIESNYDRQMLLAGPYTEQLKARILSGSGHMSNEKAAELVKQIYSRNLKALFLCHLSQNNNTPKLAVDSIGATLLSIGVSAGKDLILEALPRTTPSHIYTF